MRHAARSRRPHGRAGVVAIGCVLALVASGCNWAQFRAVGGHHGSTFDPGIELESVPGMIDLWAAGTGGPIDSSPAIVGDHAYIGSADGSLYAFSVADGSLVWSASTGGAISSSPAVSNGRVFIGSDDHTLRAFAATDGAPLWTVTVDPTFAGLASAPVVQKGKVVVASGQGVSAFSATTGSLLWSTPLSATNGLSAPALTSGTVFVSSYHDATVWALHASTGAMKWTASDPGPRATCGEAMSSPAILSGKVYVAWCPPASAPMQSVFALDAADGGVVWSGGSAPHSTSPAVTSGAVYFGSSSGNSIEALSPTDGSSLWEAVLGGPVVSSPSIAAGVLYVGADDGSLSAFDAAGVESCDQPSSTCTPLWTAMTGGPVRSSPAIAESVVFVGSDDGALHAYGLPQIAFTKSVLQGGTTAAATVADFGPDGRLYVALKDGLIKVHSIDRTAPNTYSVSSTDTIGVIRQIPNHDDDGTLNPTVTDRLITGLLVGGSASDPVVYVASSDPRVGGGSDGETTDLDTNSGIISRVTHDGTSWQRHDVVRGLPRSEENHATNSIVRDAATNTLYVGQGGHTNMGAPSNNFNFLPEYALSAAVLSIDLNAIGATTYDIPTLLDEDHPTNTTPFGGNAGKHQARLVPGGPVQVHAAGFRNPFGVALTQAGKLFVVDNGPNPGWGDVPVNEGPQGNCTNGINEPGVKADDGLHLVTGTGYYAGHPNPTRANTSNTFNPTNPQSPVSAANPIECDYRAPGSNGSIAVLESGTTGIDEYTASNFANQLRGDLLVASIKGEVHRVELDKAGTSVVDTDVLFSQAGFAPVDVVASGAADPFPGTVWVTDLAGGVKIFEPVDYDGVPPPACFGSDTASLDEDLDGYSNADEIDNGTDPCSPADVPHDWNGNFLSDLNDPNDDSDLLLDVDDPFPIDPDDGLATPFSTSYSWELGSQGNPCAPTPLPSGCPGGLLGLGFTGLMFDGTTDYTSLFDPSTMTAGGAAGVLTVGSVPPGDALGSSNDQHYAFQYGVDTTPASTPVFTVQAKLLGPFAGLSPQGDESAGVFIGNGDQDNYAKAVISANGGSTQVQVVVEIGGLPTTVATAAISLADLDSLTFFLTIDPAASSVQASYAAEIAGTPGSVVPLGGPTSIPTAWLESTTAGMALGIISTSSGGSPFAATWAFLRSEAGLPT